MKKWLILIALVVLLFGCSGGDEDSKNAGPKTDPFIGGTRGLSIQFEEGFPPAEVYDNGVFPFDIDVKLENVGESDVPADKVTVTISGIKPEEFGVTEGYLIRDGIEDDLLPTRKDGEGNVLEGSVVHVIFKDLNYQRDLEGNFNPPIRADVCYEYGTKAVSNICILENVIVPEEDTVCQINEDKKVFNTGAPVVVSNFKQMARGQDKVGFSFTIKHKGSGKVFSPGSDCASEVTNKNRVYVEVSTDLPGLSCTGLTDGDGTSGTALLYNGERTIVCTQEVDSQIAYENRVDIGIVYDYKEDISTTLLVKHSD